MICTPLAPNVWAVSWEVPTMGLFEIYEMNDQSDTTMLVGDSTEKIYAKIYSYMHEPADPASLLQLQLALNCFLHDNPYAFVAISKHLNLVGMRGGDADYLAYVRDTGTRIYEN